jgi:glycosyltransferase involved in cell wall biosynthesis
MLDGGSTDGTAEVVKESFPDCSFIVEKRSGTSYARNIGAEKSEGQFTVYTDNDCIVQWSWLRNLIANFTSPRIVTIGGQFAF